MKSFIKEKKKLEIISSNIEETQEIAGFLAKEILLAGNLFENIGNKNESKNKNTGKIFSNKTYIKIGDIKIKNNQAFLICLFGDLGAGKTTFTQGFASGLGVKEKILSPSFAIMKRFKIKNLHFKNFYHFDCYRICNGKDILDLGWKNIISQKENIILIEWPENIKSILPKNRLEIYFKTKSENIRKIKIVL